MYTTFQKSWKESLAPTPPCPLTDADWAQQLSTAAAYLYPLAWMPQPESWEPPMGLGYEVPVAAMDSLIGLATVVANRATGEELKAVAIAVARFCALKRNFLLYESLSDATAPDAESTGELCREIEEAWRGLSEAEGLPAPTPK